MALKHFIYHRKEKRNKLDEHGNPIPLLDEQGNPAGFEQEDLVLTDHFDMTRVIRTHSLSPTQCIVLLDDGHEITESVPKLRPGVKKDRGIKPGDIIEKDVVRWVQSEILLEGDDVRRYFDRLIDMPD